MSSDYMEAPCDLERLYFTEAPSAAAFSVQCRQEVRWEQPESALLPGKNQADAGKIKPPYLQLRYVPRYSTAAGQTDGYTSAVLSIHAVMKKNGGSLPEIC